MDTYILEYYMDTDSCIVYIKTEDTCVGISKDVKTRFDTSNYEFVRPLPKEKNKKVICFMKDQLGGKMMSVFATLRLKTYSYLADYKNKNRKEKQILNLKIIKII